MNQKTLFLIFIVWSALCLTFIAELFLSTRFSFLVKFTPFIIYVFYKEFEGKKTRWNNLAFWCMALIIVTTSPFIYNQLR